MQPHITPPTNPTHSHVQSTENDNKLLQIRSPVKSNFLKRRTSKSAYGNENKEPNVSKTTSFPESNATSTPLENKTLPNTPGKSKPDFAFSDMMISSREHNPVSKPAESPYTAFCRGLHLSPGPLPSISPLTYGKNGLFFGGNEPSSFISPSPLNLHIGPDNGSSPIGSRKHITKLDFNNKFVLFKNNRDEISIEQEDGHDKFEVPHFGSELSAISPKFDFPLKKSIYSNTSLIPTHSRTTDIYSQSPTMAEEHEDKDEGHQSLTRAKSGQEEQHEFESLRAHQQSSDILRTPSPTRKVYLDAANTFTEKGEAQPLVLQSAESLATQKRQSLGTSQQNQDSEFNTANSSSKSSVGKQKMDEEEDGEFDDSAAAKEASAAKKKVCCNCKKSRCLKLYCDCFARGTGCTKDCNCQNCLNNEENAEERRAAMNNTLERNPIAFKPKVNVDGDMIEVQDTQKAKHIKGCNCKKSGCLKKYCECYQAGAKCSETCKCEGCKNMDPGSSKKKPPTHGLYAGTSHASHEKSSISMQSPSTERKENARNFLTLEHAEDENSSLYNDSEDGDEMKKHLHPRKQLFTNMKSPKTVQDKKDELYLEESEKYKSGGKNKDKKRKGSIMMAPPKTPTTHSEGQKKIFEYGQSPEKQQSLSGGRTRRNIRPFSHLNPDEYELGK